MARLSRLVVPRQAHHILQRGHDRQPIFRDAEDFQSFLGWMRDAAKLYAVALHAYVLLPDQLHLLATPADADGLGRMMQWLGRHYVPYYNRKYQRTGTLWQDRFKASVIEAERYLMPCSRYIELAPVRAGIVASASDYSWSSYAHHAGVRPDSLITDHAMYWALGNTPFQREQVYRQFLDDMPGAAELDKLDRSLLKGWVLGSDQFKLLLEQRTSRRVGPAKRGRPAKAAVRAAPE